MEGNRAYRALSKITETIIDYAFFCFVFCVLLPIGWYEEVRDERDKKQRAKERLWEAVAKIEKKNGEKH